MTLQVASVFNSQQGELLPQSSSPTVSSPAPCAVMRKTVTHPSLSIQLVGVSSPGSNTEDELFHGADINCLQRKFSLQTLWHLWMCFARKQ